MRAKCWKCACCNDTRSCLSGYGAGAAALLSPTGNTFSRNTIPQVLVVPSIQRNFTQLAKELALVQTVKQTRHPTMDHLQDTLQQQSCWEARNATVSCGDSTPPQAASVSTKNESRKIFQTMRNEDQGSPNAPSSEKTPENDDQCPDPAGATVR